MEAAVEGDELLDSWLLILGFCTGFLRSQMCHSRTCRKGLSLRAKSQKLQLILLHQVAERAVGNTEQVGSFGLHSVGLIQCILQQRAFDSRNVGFHAYAFR